MKRANENKNEIDRKKTIKESEPSEQQHEKASANDLNIVTINLGIFSLFAALVFTYFVYYSQQMTELKADIYSKIIEINAINPAFPWPLTISSNSEYYYLKRNEFLFNDFRQSNDKIQKSNDKSQLSLLGKHIQTILPQITLFFPYKKMLDFKKDGSITFDPSHFESINTTGDPNANATYNKDAPKYVNIEVIKEQIDHINNSHNRFTMELENGKDRIIYSIILANGFTTEYDKAHVKNSIEAVISYLEKHYRLAIPLGLSIKKYDYIMQKCNKTIITSLSSLLILNFILGVMLPMFISEYRSNKWYWLIPQITFFSGMVILFSISIYSLPF